MCITLYDTEPIVQGCTFSISREISINKPKDVQGCSPAPEEFSFTAFLALFLSRGSQRVRVCVCVVFQGAPLPLPVTRLMEVGALWLGIGELAAAVVPRRKECGMGLCLCACACVCVRMQACVCGCGFVGARPHAKEGAVPLNSPTDATAVAVSPKAQCRLHISPPAMSMCSDICANNCGPTLHVAIYHTPSRPSTRLSLNRIHAPSRHMGVSPLHHRAATLEQGTTQRSSPPPPPSLAMPPPPTPSSQPGLAQRIKMHLCLTVECITSGLHLSVF